jgi:hypothetical protein
MLSIRFDPSGAPADANTMQIISLRLELVNEKPIRRADIPFCSVSIRSVNSLKQPQRLTKAVSKSGILWYN